VALAAGAARAVTAIAVRQAEAADSEAVVGVVAVADEIP